MVQQYSTVHTKVQYNIFQATEFQRGGRGGGHWDLGQSIERFERRQARNIVPPRLQQVNPVADTGFFFGGIIR